jgi:uncharacterized protein
MSTEPLPSTLDVRKAAVRGSSVSGVVRPQDLPRFRALLAGDDGIIRVELLFSRDEENRYLVRVVVKADVTVTCQRCLEAMAAEVAAENTLAIVWTDEQAAQLPRQLDPLIVSGESCQLWELVEEELILSLPAFSYHETEDCNRNKLAGFAEPAPQKAVDEGRPNPFDVLAQLKPGSKY